MRPRLTRVALVAATALLVLICSLSATIAASAQSGPRRVGSAPILPRGAHSLGALSGATEIPVDITLDPSDPAALSAYAQAVSTPGSADFRHFLTVAQFRQRFAPSDAQIATVRAGLEAAGLDPSAVSANGLLIQVRAPASQLASAFDTSFEQVQLASGRVAYANTSAPRLSATLANLVQAVVGLSNINLPHALGLAPARAGARAHANARTAAETAHASGGVTPCTAATKDGGYPGYTADEIASTYGFSSLYADGDTGAGQTVALMEFEPFADSDIASYNSCYGINGGSTSDVTSYAVRAGQQTGAGTGYGSGEAALDIEQILGLAPAATVDAYEAPNSDQGDINAYTDMVENPAVTVISTSWGECEPGLGSATADAEETIFEEAATQGQSVFAATGDTGSTDCDSAGGSVGSTYGSSLEVDDPGSDPYVTSVGGTSLPSTNVTSQSVWNDSSTSHGAGGGGISTFWAMPTYQSGASSSLGVVNGYSSTMTCSGVAGNTGAYCREVPDVSADADPQTSYAVYYDGAWTAIGGTSAAAPLWAALTAVANASSFCTTGEVGFANPVLYGIADSANAYANDFTDIISGNNAYTPSGYGGSLYQSKTGYDMASGLGTPNGATLIPAMCSAAAGSGTERPGTTTTVTETVTQTVTTPGTTTTQTVTTPGTTTITQTVTDPGVTTTITAPGTTTTVTAPGTTTTVTAPGTTTTVTAPGTTTTVTAPGTTTTVTKPGTTTTVTDTTTKTVSVTTPGPTTTVTTPGPTQTVIAPGPTTTVYDQAPVQTVTRTVTVTVRAGTTPKVTVSQPKAGQTAVAVRLSCPAGGPPCTITGTLTAAEAVKSIRSAAFIIRLSWSPRATRATSRTVTVATAHLKLAAGRTGTLKLSLDAAAKLMVKRAKKLKLTLHLSSDGTALAAHTVTFSVAKAK